jgi:hypothetical protein
MKKLCADAVILYRNALIFYGNGSKSCDNFINFTYKIEIMGVL